MDIETKEIPQEGLEIETAVAVDEQHNYELEIERLNRRVVFLSNGKKIKDDELEKDFDGYIKKYKTSYIKTRRKGNPFDKEPNVKKVWDVLMKYANFANLNRCGVKLQRGELLATYKLLANHTGLSEDQVRYAIEKLESKYKELYRVNYRGVQIYTMLKYEEHQGKKPKLKQQNIVIHPLIKQPVYNLTLVVNGDNFTEIVYSLKKLASGELDNSEIINSLIVADKNTGEVYTKYESSLSVEEKYVNNVDVRLENGSYAKFSSVTFSERQEIWDSIDNDKLIGFLKSTKEVEEAEKKSA